jgi:GT2 family glycosyltransferase
VGNNLIKGPVTKPKQQVAATGAAFLLIQREVLQGVGIHYPHVFPWFAEAVRQGKPVGEDVEFCLRAGSLGFKTYVDADIKVGHVKTLVI